ncbi:AAA family ATPase [Morganella sp. GD04133]|uniref:AAA family ATPase n=1 Tax=Morganella sp. GD04133 TaxID=2975435 RepID=UPI002447CE4E|nr:AAA family ATPase [Morganella sp. GD04133]MDH0353282.1 AAA family ATPase [Morganella sp. GD04133]
MLTIDLHQLIRRLTPPLMTALEAAAQECVRRRHRAVTPLHWLLVIAGCRELAWCAAPADNNALQYSLNDALALLPQAADGSPVFAPELTELLKQLWLHVSLNQGGQHISEIHILQLLRQTACSGVPPAVTAWAQSLDPQWLAQQITALPQASAPAAGSTGGETLLSAYARDLTALARAGKLDPVIGRDSEIRQILDIFCRRRQNSPIMVGEAGVGKTAIAEGLAQAICDGNVPERLRGCEVWELDLTALQAGAAMKGEFEQRLKNLLAEIRAGSAEKIIFIDEAHTLIGAGGTAGQGDAANILKPALARGEFRALAATTWSEYKQFIEPDPALTRRFQQVKIAPPDEAATLTILRALKPVLEQHHGLPVTEAACEAAVRLSVRYLPERQLPDKAISLLDTACAGLSVSQSVTPDSAAEAVDDNQIAAVIALWTGIPAGHLAADDISRLSSLEAKVAERVIGQTAPVAAVAQAIRIARSGLNNPQRPQGVFLMCGPGGTGKTETTLALCEALCGDDRRMVTLNMTEFKEPHKVSMLLGAPAGYTGYGKGGVLTEAVRRNPYTILLLDEMEKAHPAIHDVFYQIFDKGRITDSEGREVDFRHTIIIMTSNAAEDEIVAHCGDERPGVTELVPLIFPALLRHFRPSFLGRTTIIPYYPLSDTERAAIARLALDRVGKRIHETYQCEFSYSDELITYLLSLPYSAETGARAVEQGVTGKLLPQIAEACIEKRRQQTAITRVLLSVTDNKPVVSID